MKKISPTREWQDDAFSVITDTLNQLLVSTLFYPPAGLLAHQNIPWSFPCLAFSQLKGPHHLLHVVRSYPLCWDVYTKHPFTEKHYGGYCAFSPQIPTSGLVRLSPRVWECQLMTAHSCVPPSYREQLPPRFCPLPGIPCCRWLLAQNSLKDLLKCQLQLQGRVTSPSANPAIFIQREGERFLRHLLTQLWWLANLKSIGQVSSLRIQEREDIWSLKNFFFFGKTCLSSVLVFNWLAETHPPYGN